MRCGRCGEENPERARFCLACGAPLTGESKQERKVISVLFADLVGFTGRSHDGDPEDVRDTLHAYHGAAKEAIESFGGNLEKFIGDAVMAVFGAPISHGDDAERAVRAGLKVLAAVEDLGLRARAAVNTGEAVVAVGAAASSGQALAMGDVVNTASRLQSAALPGALVVGHEAYLLTGHMDEATGLARSALAFARARKARGNEAYALRLLGEIHAHQDPPAAEAAEAAYRQAVALADELGMRPLLAHCHLGLGTLYTKVGQLAQARAALSTAIELFQAMEMTFWLPRAEATLAHTA